MYVLYYFNIQYFDICLYDTIILFQFNIKQINQ